jgi:outer membrane protein OmpA-like peptidoglycan-associated protein
MSYHARNFARDARCRPNPASKMRRVATNARVRNYPIPLRASSLKVRGCVMLFFVAILCVVQHPLFAQDQKPSLFVGGSFASNKANASIDALDGNTPCGVFQNGNGGAPSMFGGITFPFTDKFSIDVKLEYDNLSTAFETLATSIVKNTPLAYNLFNNSYDSILRNRFYNASLGMAGAAAMVSYSILPRLKISAGPFLGVLIERNYNETEGLVYPADSTARYTTGLSTRTISSSMISNVNVLQTGMEFSASYELPFEPHLALRPSFGATIPFTPITSHLYVYTIGASLSLVYHFSEPPVQEPAPAIVNNIPAPQQAEPKPVETPAPSSPIPPKRAMLTVSVKALGVGDDGKEVSEPVISIERTHVTEVYPLLHYVFFDDGSSEIPERYHRETAATRGAFHEKDLFTANALEIHHHVLDILGARLAKKSDASVTLVGARSEHSPNDSLFGNVIALDRAKSIQDYLATVWGISRERLRLRERTLPEIASDDHNSFGQAENRRVEIIPSSPEVTAPLRTERIERVATPPRIDFEPEITANAGIRSATITVYQHGRVLRTIDALSDSAASEYLWTIDDRSMPDDAPEVEDSLRYVFAAVDSLGDTAEAFGVIRLRKQTSDIIRHAGDTSLDKQIERYSLILFDYSSSQLDKKESEVIIKEMASAVQTHAHVTLTGHTDKTGDDAFNDRLAHDRVMRAAQMLETELKNRGEKIPPIAMESRGSRDNLFDNSIPEGRVLSRTVRATIENDIKQR